MFRNPVSMRDPDCRFAASLLTADFASLATALAQVESQVDYFHLDVMDGHFVPPLSFGAATVAAIGKRTRTPLDVHLMVANAEAVWRDYAKAGAARISVHYEAVTHLARLLADIRAAGLQAGVALCPATPACLLRPALAWIDYIVVMTVNPGYGGQAYLTNADTKIASVAALLKQESCADRIRIMADGGLDCRTLAGAYRAGAREFVFGSSIFADNLDPRLALEALDARLPA